MELTYISKKDMTASEALLNKGILWGEAPFTTTLIRKGKITFEELHLERLKKTIEYLYPKSIETLAHIKLAMNQMANEFKEIDFAYMRVTLFESIDGSLEFFIWCMKRAVSSKALKLGLQIDSPSSVLPRFLKMADYSYKFRLRNELRKSGLDDCLFKNDRGELLDSSIANAYFIKDKKVYVSKLIPGVLEGTCRKKFLAFLESEGIEVCEEIILESDLEKFDEVWLTNSFSGLQRVKEINDIEYREDYYHEVVEKFIKYSGEIWPRKS